ncbi:unnamed protein product [Amoebophrya sp. A25]|nr:unnamed protein product [Amoebophrya sp. A25]|eukprot:GSA25T00011169001.1
MPPPSPPVPRDGDATTGLTDLQRLVRTDPSVVDDILQYSIHTKGGGDNDLDRTVLSGEQMAQMKTGNQGSKIQPVDGDVTQLPSPADVRVSTEESERNKRSRSNKEEKKQSATRSPPQPSHVDASLEESRIPLSSSENAGVTEEKIPILAATNDTLMSIDHDKQTRPMLSVSDVTSSSRPVGVSLSKNIDRGLIEATLAANLGGGVATPAGGTLGTMGPPVSSRSNATIGGASAGSSRTLLHGVLPGGASGTTGGGTSPALDPNAGDVDNVGMDMMDERDAQLLAGFTGADGTLARPSRRRGPSALADKPTESTRARVSSRSVDVDKRRSFRGDRQLQDAAWSRDHPQHMVDFHQQLRQSTQSGALSGGSSLPRSPNRGVEPVTAGIALYSGTGGKPASVDRLVVEPLEGGDAEVKQNRVARLRAEHGKKKRRESEDASTKSQKATNNGGRTVRTRGAAAQQSGRGVPVFAPTADEVRSPVLRLPASGPIDPSRGHFGTSSAGKEFRQKSNWVYAGRGSAVLEEEEEAIFAATASGSASFSPAGNQSRYRAGPKARYGHVASTSSNTRRPSKNYNNAQRPDRSGSPPASRGQRGANSREGSTQERTGAKSNLVPSSNDLASWLENLPTMSDNERAKLVLDLVAKLHFLSKCTMGADIIWQACADLRLLGYLSERTKQRILALETSNDLAFASALEKSLSPEAGSGIGKSTGASASELATECENLKIELAITRMELEQLRSGGAQAAGGDAAGLVPQEDQFGVLVGASSASGGGTSKNNITTLVSSTGAAAALDGTSPASAGSSMRTAGERSNLLLRSQMLNPPPRGPRAIFGPELANYAAGETLSGINADLEKHLRYLKFREHTLEIDTSPRERGNLSPDDVWSPLSEEGNYDELSGAMSVSSPSTSKRTYYSHVVERTDQVSPALALLDGVQTSHLTFMVERFPTVRTKAQLAKIMNEVDAFDLHALRTLPKPDAMSKLSLQRVLKALPAVAHTLLRKVVLGAPPCTNSNSRSAGHKNSASLTSSLVSIEGIDSAVDRGEGLIQVLYPDRASLLARLREEPPSEQLELLMSVVRDKMEDVQVGFLRHLLQPDPDSKLHMRKVLNQLDNSVVPRLYTVLVRGMHEEEHCSVTDGSAIDGGDRSANDGAEERRRSKRSNASKNSNRKRSSSPGASCIDQQDDAPGGDEFEEAGETQTVADGLSVSIASPGLGGSAGRSDGPRKNFATSTSAVSSYPAAGADSTGNFPASGASSSSSSGSSSSSSSSDEQQEALPIKKTKAAARPRGEGEATFEMTMEPSSTARHHDDLLLPVVEQDRSSGKHRGIPAPGASPTRLSGSRVRRTVDLDSFLDTLVDDEVATQISSPTGKSLDDISPNDELKRKIAALRGSRRPPSAKSTG